MDYTIRELTSVGEAEIAGLSRVLVECVRSGASVSFLWPLDAAKAASFWRQVAAGVRAKERVLLVAEGEDGAIVGTVQLLLSLPENQPHRAEVAKMLVQPDTQKLGLGGRLLREVETAAAVAGKSLLVLDTVTGAAGERLYIKNGWQRCGVIPDYALFPDGRPCSTTVLYKTVSRT